MPDYRYGTEASIDKLVKEKLLPAWLNGRKADLEPFANQMARELFD